MDLARPSLRDGLLLDILFAAALLAVHFAVYYHRWPMWHDQAVFHYMAWGLDHGMVPYRDMIDLNWPGMIFVHLAARAISGADAFGLRLLDCLFALLLCGATSAFLSRYGVARPLRLLSIAAYLSAYFATGFESTAQRESFMLPLVAVGLTACLTHHKREAPLPALAWFGTGALTSLGLWMKPTLGLVVVAAVAAMLAISARRGELAWRQASSMLAGALAASALMAVFIVVWCDPYGFFHWGIEYAFGSYASAPWSSRLDLLAQNTLASPLPWPTTLVLVGILAVAVDRVRRRTTSPPPGTSPGDVALAAGLLVVVGTSVMLQGRTHYQFHPLRWVLALTGCVLLAAAVRHARPIMPRKVAAIVCSVIVALDLVSRPTGYIGRRHASVLAEILEPHLAPSDQVVTFGFSPTLLSDLGRKTPYPFLVGIVMYVSADGVRRYEVEIGETLAAAAAHPEVKVIVIERIAWSIYGWDPSRPSINSQDVAYEFLPPERLGELGFVRVPSDNIFDVYVRNASQEEVDAVSEALLTAER